MRPLKVGMQIPNSKKVMSYLMIPHVYDLIWIDAEKYLPQDYDLVDMKLEKKVVKGWHALGKWHGLKYPKNAIVKFWRKLAR
jgi:hypothetical protein